jgi:L-ascorbate metabolism protein UlaG (beta-lactamase superfamily)
MKVEIEFLGHSGFLLRGKEGTLAIDPFLTGNPVAVKKHGEVACDYIALTHGHEDHMGDALDISKSNNAKVIASYEICEYLETEGAHTDPGNTGGKIATSFGWVAFTQAFHSSSYKGRYMGQPCGVVARFEHENFTFYHLGDTALFSDLHLLGELYMPDVAAIPVGDRFTMGPEQGRMAAEMVRPGIAIPIHWGTFPVLAQDISAFKPAGVEVRVMRPGETIQCGTRSR